MKDPNISSCISHLHSPTPFKAKKIHQPYRSMKAPDTSSNISHPNPPTLHLPRNTQPGQPGLLPSGHMSGPSGATCPGRPGRPGRPATCPGCPGRAGHMSGLSGCISHLHPPTPLKRKNQNHTEPGKLFFFKHQLSEPPHPFGAKKRTPALATQHPARTARTPKQQYERSQHFIMHQPTTLPTPLKRENQSHTEPWKLQTFLQTSAIQTPPPCTCHATPSPDSPDSCRRATCPGCAGRVRATCPGRPGHMSGLSRATCPGRPGRMSAGHMSGLSGPHVRAVRATCAGHNHASAIYIPPTP